MRLALGTVQPGPQTLSVLRQANWKTVLDEAKRQAVTGLVYLAVSRLPEDFSLPDEVLFRLVSRSRQIELRGQAMGRASVELQEQLETAGLHPVLMKGAQVAGFYAQPAFREYGDIDLYLPPEEKLPMACEMAPDGSAHFVYQGIDVDVHRHYFDLHRESALPPVPSPEATLLMLSAHSLKHAVGAGIGLRQLCDMAAAYLALDGQYSPDSLRSYYKEHRLVRWNKLVNSFLQVELGVPDRLYGDAQPSSGPLLRMLEEGGNFGHHAASRSKALEQSPLRRKADTAWRFLKRLPFSLHYAPGEALPIFITLIKGNIRIFAG